MKQQNEIATKILNLLNYTCYETSQNEKHIVYHFKKYIDSMGYSEIDIIDNKVIEIDLVFIECEVSSREVLEKIQNIYKELEELKNILEFILQN